jgi:aminoglycoside phosphotransferase (APT) family kinase protein
VNQTGSYGSTEREKLRAWIEREIGGTVTRLVPQPRWRRGWYATVTGVPGVDQLYVRGTRDSDFVAIPVELEGAFHDIAERHGVPVPHLYGICPDPLAMVMDQIPGSRDISGLDAAGKLGISTQYAEILAKLHAIPEADFVSAGLWRAASPGDAAMEMISRYEDSYRRNLKVRPEPFCEFLGHWLRRHLPRDRTEMCFVTGDPGQFLADETGKITAIHDLEMGYLGDPLADLAPLRARHAFEPMGDIGLVYRRYAELTGRRLDHNVLSYYMAWWGYTGAMWIVRMLAEANADHLRSLYSQVAGPFFAMQGMAEVMGVRFEKMKRPDPIETRRAATFGSLRLLLDQIEPDTEPVSRYRLEAARGLSDVLVQFDGLGEALDRMDLDDCAVILGHRPDNWLEADTELEKFVATAGPEHDVALLRFFDRRRQRSAMLLPRSYISGTPGDIAGREAELEFVPLTELLPAA